MTKDVEIKSSFSPGSCRFHPSPAIMSNRLLFAILFGALLVTLASGRAVAEKEVIDPTNEHDEVQEAKVKALRMPQVPTDFKLYSTRPRQPEMKRLRAVENVRAQLVEISGWWIALLSVFALSGVVYCCVIIYSCVSRCQCFRWLRTLVR